MTRSICVAREGESEGSRGVQGYWEVWGAQGVAGWVDLTSAAAKLSGLLPAAAYSETASQEPAAPADAVLQLMLGCLNFEAEEDTR